MGKRRQNGVQPKTTTALVNDADAADSPLRLFGEAKEKINSLYEKLEKCLNNANGYYSDPKQDSDVVQNLDLDQLKRLNKRIETIRGILSRDLMKVAFFGTTSNGKSTVINAILHDNVLPRGSGVTTKCFLQIQGTDSLEPFVEVQKKGQPEERKPISYVTQMANARNDDSLECSTLLKIYWPISKCPLLKYDVVFMDSPGIALNQNLDEWIYDYCHDADLFVLVSDAMRALNSLERDFFHKVSEKLSKPNIFILNNRFDVVAQEEPDSISYNRVRELSSAAAVDFLSRELEISSNEEAKQRTFFVSAKETLADRCPGATRTGEFRQVSGYVERCEEFLNFEQRFEESLSKSAVRTKFMKHCDKGKETISELTTILNNTQAVITKVAETRMYALRHCYERYERIQKLLYANKGGLQSKISDIRKRIEVVSDLATEEIRRLSKIVDDFDTVKFTTEPDKLQYYKERLYDHVEANLSKKLRMGISTVINKHVDPFNQAMLQISILLSEDRQQRMKQIITSQSSIQEELFDLKNYKQFYTKFQEDLEFRDTLGLMSIVRKFRKQISVDTQPEAYQSGETDFFSMMRRLISMHPPDERTAAGSLAVVGILFRTVGWNVIILTTTAYGTWCAYQYLTWTNSAKERALKNQYVHYARKRLQECVLTISQQVANSVEKNMTITLGELKTDADKETTEINSKISMLKNSLEKLRACDEFTRTLLGENNIILSELVGFASSFLA